jgi:hypothetical protein
MKKLKNFSKTELKREIINRYGSVGELKRELKRGAKYQWDTWTNETEIYGCRITYTDNKNCFASYIIEIPHVGFISQYGLGKSAITKAGKLRLGSTIKQHYIQL